MSGYDENLLKDAPEASRAERREGYNIDLLVPERTQSPPARTPSAPPGPSFPSVPGETEFATGTNGPGAKEYGSISQEEDGGAPRPDAKPVSFWRTNKGKLLIVLIVLVVIGAIVGGAVGGATSSKGGSKITNPSGVAQTSNGPTSSSTSTQSNNQPADSRKSSAGNGSQPTSSTAGNAQGPSSSGGGIGQAGSSTPTGTTPKSTEPIGGGVNEGRRVFGGSPTAADSSRDRRRHPSPARGVAGAEADD